MSSAEIRTPGEREPESLWTWLVPILMAVLLVASSRIGFLLFHTLAELFAVFVAITLSVVMWQTYSFTRNDMLMFLGCGYFWVGVLDLVHALAYKDMSILPVAGANASTQIWIATRYLEAFVLLLAPLFLRVHLVRGPVFVLFGAVAVILLWWIFNGRFPDTFIEGQGLTRFKVTSEYVIIAILGLAGLHLWRHRRHIDHTVLVMMSVSIGLTMAAELAFTFYVSVFGLSNLVGHVFKLFSYWLIFVAMVRTTLREPFRAMSRELSTYDAIPDPIIVTDRDGYLLQLNDAALEAIGAPVETLDHRHCHALFHSPRVSIDACEVCRCLADGRPLNAIEVEVGDGRWREISLSPVGGKEAVGGMVQVIRDITDKKSGQSQVRSAEERIRLLLDSTGEGIYGIDTEGRCTFVNAACVRMLGYGSDAELLGRKMHELMHHTRSDGSAFPAEECPIYSAWREGRMQEVEEDIMWRKDGTSFPVSYRSYPVRENGVIIGAVCIFTDISEQQAQKQEWQRLEAQLQHAQKLEAIGHLTGGIAHDFNNILACVLGFSSLAREKIKDSGDDKLLSYLEQIISSGEKARELISQMLLFSRRKADNSRDPVILQPLVKEVVKMLQSTMPASIHIDLRMAEEDLIVRIDPVQFHQVLMNLCINARDAMHGKGRLGILLRRSTGDEETVCASCHESFVTHGVELVVTDTGEGMPANLRSRIFDPFFTTKDVGQGTGMGLSVVHGIVHQHGGHIALYSMPGEGCQFHIWWPEASIEAHEPAERPVRDDDELNTGHVLVVEDEQTVSGFIDELLQTAGFSVTVTGSAEQALVFCSEHCDRIDLVLTDYTMPGMTGIDLARRIHAVRPDLPVILMSGYEIDIDERTIAEAGLSAILRKPVESSRLLKVISDAIAERSTG